MCRSVIGFSFLLKLLIQTVIDLLLEVMYFRKIIIKHDLKQEVYNVGEASALYAQCREIK